MDPVAKVPAASPALPVSPTAQAKPTVSGAKGKEHDTAREFEAVFLGQMTQMMMESVDTGEGFNGGHGEEMFRGVMAEKLGQEMARKGGIGLAPTVMGEIIKLQGGQ